MRFAVLLIALLWPPTAAAEGIKDDKGVAREHFERGRTLYDLGKYEAAAREFEAAYEARRDPAFLFNIAQSNRFAGKYQQALVAYRSFLRNLPETPSRAKVEKSIAELERLLEQQTAVQGPPTELNPPPTEPAPSSPPAVVVVHARPVKQPVYKKWWLWTTVGLVVAGGVAVGLGLGLSQSHGGNLRVLPPATGAP